jgi:hypothetical protein
VLPQMWEWYVAFALVTALAQDNQEDVAAGVFAFDKSKARDYTFIIFGEGA